MGTHYRQRHGAYCGRVQLTLGLKHLTQYMYWNSDAITLTICFIWIKRLWCGNVYSASLLFLGCVGLHFPVINERESTKDC